MIRGWAGHVNCGGERENRKRANRPREKPTCSPKVGRGRAAKTAAGGRALLAISVMIAGDGRAPTAYARPRFIYIYAGGERTR